MSTKKMLAMAVKPGQGSVSVNASRLAKGLNIVSVSGGVPSESCKVIVK